MTEASRLLSEADADNYQRDDVVLLRQLFETSWLSVGKAIDRNLAAAGHRRPRGRGADGRFPLVWSGSPSSGNEKEQLP